MSALRDVRHAVAAPRWVQALVARDNIRVGRRPPPPAGEEQNRLQETTSILLEALKANRPDQSHLQTQLLAMNLQQAPKVAEARALAGHRGVGHGVRSFWEACRCCRVAKYMITDAQCP